MDINEFSNNLCYLNTSIARYLDANKALGHIKQGNLHLPNDVIITIEDVLHERICQCEKKIIEQATKLTQSKD